MVTKEATCEADAPILIHDRDVLTAGTRNAIETHNDAYWCRCPDKLPAGAEPPICPIVGD